jgi:hypothetical protein
MTDQNREAALNTLRAMVEEMSQFQAKAALTMIIQGIPFEEAIDRAYAMGLRYNNRNIQK